MSPPDQLTWTHGPPALSLPPIGNEATVIPGLPFCGGSGLSGAVVFSVGGGSASMVTDPVDPACSELDPEQADRVRRNAINRAKRTADLDI